MTKELTIKTPSPPRVTHPGVEQSWLLPGSHPKPCYQSVAAGTVTHSSNAGSMINQPCGPGMPDVIPWDRDRGCGPSSALLRADQHQEWADAPPTCTPVQGGVRDKRDVAVPA